MSKHSGEADAILQYSFLKVFADDNTIDAHELAFMEKLALRDGIVDEDEKRVLHDIFARVGQDQVTPGVWQEIQRFKKQAGID